MTNELNIHCDGGARGNPGPAASAFVVTDTQGLTIYEQGFYLGVSTNNQAEYHAVLYALRWLSENDAAIRHVNFFLDSQLVVNQLNGLWKIKDPGLKVIHTEIQNQILSLHHSVPKTIFSYIPRTQNSRADLLVNQTLDQHR